MPSPFPGMDPWLEDQSIYGDLRFSFVVRLSAKINSLLPDAYCSRIRHIMEEGQCFKECESYVDIIQIAHPDHVSLTSIEIPELLPTWRDCRAKVKWPVARITIRLFRDRWNSHNGMPSGPEIITRRIGDGDCLELSPIDYRHPLPMLSVPFAANLPPLEFPLQPVLDEVYQTGRYSMRVKYRTKRPDPPLTAEQQTWAEGILKAKGLLP